MSSDKKLVPRAAKPAEAHGDNKFVIMCTLVCTCPCVYRRYIQVFLFFWVELIVGVM